MNAAILEAQIADLEAQLAEARALLDNVRVLTALGKKLDDAFTPDTRPLMCAECYGGDHPHGFNGCPLCHCPVRIPAQLVLVGRAS